jgi:DNA-binding NtrC family response regulator
MGLIEEADGGTLYLNEVADSSLRFQIKLLDALERKVIRRLGETKERPVAFRLIAATNHDVDRHIIEGSFRIDLYHRLCEFPIHLPLLSDRREDIPALLMHFLTLAGMDYKGNGDGESFQRLVETLSSKDWPGNIRELKAEIRRLILISNSDISAMIETTPEPRTVIERSRLRELLQQTHWNRRQVARILGMSEGGIRYRIKKYQIGP